MLWASPVPCCRTQSRPSLPLAALLDLMILPSLDLLIVTFLTGAGSGETKAWGLLCRNALCRLALCKSRCGVGMPSSCSLSLRGRRPSFSRRLPPPLLLRRPRRAQRLAHAAVPRPPVGVGAGGAAVPHGTAGAASEGREEGPVCEEGAVLRVQSSCCTEAARFS